MVRNEAKLASDSCCQCLPERGTHSYNCVWGKLGHAEVPCLAMFWVQDLTPFYPISTTLIRRRGRTTMRSTAEPL
jgi:hypothetical protein